MMDKKELSPEKRKALYDNLGKSIVEFHLMLPIYIVASGQCRNSVHKSLLRAGYTILYSVIDISSLFRAEIREQVVVGKCMGVIKLKVAVSEAFKAIIGANPDDNKALYSQIRPLLEVEFSNECHKIDVAITKFRANFWTSQVQEARNIVEHFSDNPYEYYKLLLEASEETEANRVIALMAIVQPLFSVIAKVVDKEHLLNIISDKDILSYKGSFEAIPENTPVDHNFEDLGNIMEENAKLLDEFARNYNLPQVIEKRLGHIEINEPIKYMLQLLELMMHLELVSIDALYNYRAICSSQIPLEQRLNLRMLYKTNHEGFKKLYGFKDDKTNTIWENKIASQMHSYSDSIRSEYESLNNSLKMLSKQKGINDENLVVVLTHLRKNKNKDYISDALIELGRLNIREVMITSMLFVYVLSKIIQFSRKMLPEIKRMSDKLHNKSMEKLFQPMNDIIDKIKCSDMDEERKNDLVRVLKDSRKQFENLFYQ